MSQAPDPRPRRRRPPPGALLKSVSVTDLFGKYSYERLDFLPRAANSSNVSVLIGDNGSGKTTLLRLIYASLSHEESAGLRTYIAKTPFRNLSIELASGERILIQKQKLIGDFTLTILAPGREPAAYPLQVDPDASVRMSTQEDPAVVHSLHEALKSLDIDVLFIDHTRRVRSTYQFLEDLRTNDNKLERVRTSRRYSSPDELSERLRLDFEEFPLPQIVSALHDWFRVRAFRQGATGEQDASSVYLEVIKTLGRRKKPAPLEPQSAAQIAEELHELNSQTEPYIRHGLLSRYPFAELVDLVKAANRSKIPQIQAVLAPFLTSIRRRIDALTIVQSLISVFEEELNRYFRDKVAGFHILGGLSITDMNSVLSIEALSSGERQLVFLLSAALLSREGRSLILIDEPELSLNYKWQRLIASSLARVASGSNTQFVLASHSIEIISRHVDGVVEL